MPMRTFIAIATLAAALGAAAQDWGLRWIACPGAGPCSQVWFRRAFTVARPPLSARVTIASAGRYELFVNGYNVTTDVLAPSAGPPGDTIRVMTYEVGRFLRPDTNVVAVWYSPLAPTRKQLSLSLCAPARGGDAIALHADGAWLCRPAGAETALPCPGGMAQPSPYFQLSAETVDDNLSLPGWNLPGAPVVGWLHAAEQYGLPPQPLAVVRPPYAARRIASIRSYTFLDDHGSTLVYHFGRRFDGWVRLTLRGMHRGDTLRVNGLTYICSGRTDEQACRRFTSAASSIAVVSGPEHFSRKNVMSVEAIDIETYTHRSLLY